MSKTNETESKELSDNASFVFLSNKYQFTKVAASLHSSPTVTLSPDEIDVTVDQVSELAYCEEADLENRPITVFRYEGKHLVIFATKRCREAIQNGSTAIKAKLLTKHTLKRCLFDENARETSQFLQQQIRESLNPPARQRFDNPNYRQRENRQDFHQRHNDTADSSRPFKRGF